VTAQEYAEIAAACDRLLRAAGTSLARIAIPTLHVISEHPSCTWAYDSALHPERPRRGMRPLAEWEDSPRAALRAARAIARGSFGESPSLQPTATGPVDVLIVSHLVNASQLQPEDDFYFGPLQRLLNEQGATSMLAFVNHLPPQRARGIARAAAVQFNRRVLPDRAPPRIETRLWLQCLRARNALRDAARATDNPVDRAVAMLASRHAWLAPAVANLRLHRSIAELCRSLTPRIVLTTYEGEACERLIWHAARSNGLRPLCVGYQHTRLLPLSHAIRRPIGVRELDCDPDVVLTLGDIPHAALASSPELAALRLIKYGSHRRPPNQLAPPEARGNVCLVLPDSDPYETAILFEFAVACAQQLPETTFALRPHPGTNLEMFRRLTPVLDELPANAIASVNKTLAEDCAAARYCLYRGSSAVVQAVMSGIKPFYVSRADELPFDPLGSLPSWRETVSAPEQFVTRLRAAGVANDLSAAREASSFCQQYTAQLRPAALSELLELAARGAPAMPASTHQGGSRAAARIPPPG
jgi:hypothetical protein